MSQAVTSSKVTLLAFASESAFKTIEGCSQLGIPDGSVKSM
jgi:hypothetical protein